MKLYAINKHTYAPELGRVIIGNKRNKAVYKLEGVDLNKYHHGTLLELIRGKFSPVRVGKYATITVTCGTFKLGFYSGYIASYKELLEFKEQIKKRHNLKNTVFTIKTKIIG